MTSEVVGGLLAPAIVPSGPRLDNLRGRWRFAMKGCRLLSLIAVIGVSQISCTSPDKTISPQSSTACVPPDPRYALYVWPDPLMSHGVEARKDPWYGLACLPARGDVVGIRKRGPASRTETRP